MGKQRKATKKMREKKQFYAIQSVEDRRPKPTRIRQEISSYASNGQLYFPRHLHALWTQFVSYPAVNHDDWLDALAIGLMAVEEWMWAANLIEGEFEVIGDKPLLEDWRSAP